MNILFKSPEINKEKKIERSVLAQSLLLLVKNASEIGRLIGKGGKLGVAMFFKLRGMPA